MPTSAPATPNPVTLNPIGFVRTPFSRKWELPRQPGLSQNSATIDCKGLLPREALEDLDGFDRIWVLFHFHRAGKSKSKVRPPRGNAKRGVLATRTPHHPNGMGISCVRLTGIKDFFIEIADHDLLDGTPVFDIKPYIPYCDSFPQAKAGWVDQLGPEQLFEVQCTERGKKELSWLADRDCHIYDQIEGVLSRRPHPYPNHRVENLGEGLFCLSLKSWRIFYTIDGSDISLQRITSGYTHLGEMPEIHTLFTEEFARK